MTPVLGIDVGATKIAAALVDPTHGTVLSEETIPTPLVAEPAEVLEACVALAERLTSSGRVSAVGIGLCELVSPAGEIRSAVSLDWRYLDVKGAFAPFGPVTIESDVRAAALAEAQHGAGRDLGSFLYVNAGSGVSSCLVLDGVPYSGAHGAAILIGCAPLNAEEAAGGRGIAQQYGAPSAKDVAAAADSGDRRAVEVLEAGGSALGAAIGFAVNIIDPDAVVLGGALALNAARYRTALERSLRSSIWSDDARDLVLVDAQLAGRAGVVGAATVAAQRALVEAR